ncbi:MAG: hypothetical protein ABIQ57_01860 [Candidatus Kapaibacterium sp.]
MKEVIRGVGLHHSLTAAAVRLILLEQLATVGGCFNRPRPHAFPVAFHLFIIVLLTVALLPVNAAGTSIDPYHNRSLARTFHCPSQTRARLVLTVPSR